MSRLDMHADRISEERSQYGPERYIVAFEGAMRGRIDLVHKAEDGIELVDYKTGIFSTHMKTALKQ